MGRGLAYKRQMRRKHIKRKSRIIKNTWFLGVEQLDNAVFRGKLNKGKVHCSCSLCSTKTKRDGYKARDRREIERLDQSEKDISLRY